MNILCALGIIILGVVIASKSKGTLIGNYNTAPTKRAQYYQPLSDFSQGVQQEPQVESTSSPEVDPLGDIYDIIG